MDLPSGSLPLAFHSLTAIALGEGVTEAVSFGGYCKWPNSFKSAADLDPIDETTVMRFGKLVPVQLVSMLKCKPRPLLVTTP